MEKFQAQQPYPEKISLEGIFADKPRGEGRLIVVCGFDASGKSTQVEALTSRLRALGKDVVTTRQPTDWYRGQPEVRRFLDNGEGRTQMRFLALMAAADRLRHVDSVIRPALERGAYVVCDRYVFATMALFTHRGLEAQFLRIINAGIPRPDHAFFLDVPAPVLQARLRARDGDSLKYEERSTDTIQSILDIYHRNEWPLTFVDGCKAADAITSEILAAATAGHSHEPKLVEQ